VHDDRTTDAIRGFLANAGDRCPFIETSTRFAAWQLGRIFAELGRELPTFVRALDAEHLEADGVSYQIQVLEGQGLVALIPVSSTVAPPAHLKREIF
jgi:hypothetical protein